MFKCCMLHACCMHVACMLSSLLFFAYVIAISKQTAEARIKELEGSVRELKGIMEVAEKESESRYAALQQQHNDLQVQKLVGLLA